MLIALTSHLWFSQAIAACATDSIDDAAAQTVHHESHHQPSDHHSPRQPTDAPAKSQCCLALASCGPSIALAPVASSTTIAAVHLTSPLGVVFPPASRVAAPEPPPPRA